jgi:prepilin-type N-terminal cleavage/methylation domain-containing protein
MAKIRNSRGFSLIEMAIVLVIIGIIIAAIIKGQDLMTNSRAKQLTSAVSTYRTLAMAFLDRNGRFPGAGVNDVALNVNAGMIYKNGGAAFANISSPGTELSKVMINRPPQPVTIGSLVFYIYLGHTTGDNAGRNVIVVCKDSACTGTFTADELELIKVVDASFDGSADAGLGQVRGATAVSITSGYAKDTMTLDKTTAGATALWSTTHVAAVWSFDRPW